MRQLLARARNRFAAKPPGNGAMVTKPMRASKIVLLAWELGRGLGHIHRLLPIARELTMRGYRVVFALREQAEAKSVTVILPQAQVVQAPIFIPIADPAKEHRRSACNYADMLHSCGYESVETLEPLVASWHALFDTVSPALIVCDHSPTAVLAAAGRLPVIHVGSGFANPPVGQPLLDLYPQAEDGVEARVARVLESIRVIREYHRLPPPTQPSDLFGWTQTFACSLPELDPYRSVRPQAALGPIHRLPVPMPPARRNFIFGYLAGDDSRVPRLLQSLVRAKVLCSLYLRQAPPQWADALSGTTVKLFEVPQNMGEIIGAASAVLHHGGVSTTEMALAIGRPQFLLPRYVEQGLTAESIESMGCGVNLTMRKEDAGECIRRSLSYDLHGPTATWAAAMVAARPATDVKGLIVAACLRHLE